MGPRVEGWDGIRRADAYDELAFASGGWGGVGEGRRWCRRGIVLCAVGWSVVTAGHVTLLGDLEAVGRCFGGGCWGGKERVLGKGERREGQGGIKGENGKRRLRRRLR